MVLRALQKSVKASQKVTLVSKNGKLRTCQVCVIFFGGVSAAYLNSQIVWESTPEF